MGAKPMQPVVRAWALNGCLAVTMGVIALAWAVVAGPRDIGEAVAYGIVYTGLTAGLTILPSLRSMEVAAVAPADAVLQTSRRAAFLFVVNFALLVALVGIVATLVPHAMFLLGALGLITGTLWLGAALRVRQRELRRTDGRLVMGNRASRFRPWTDRFFVVAL